MTHIYTAPDPSPPLTIHQYWSETVLNRKEQARKGQGWYRKRS